MTYNPLIPVGNISPQNQVTQVQTNFFEFARVFAINHTALNLPNEGDHETILLTIQNADPEITQNLDILYAKNFTSNIDTQPQLFVRVPEFLPNKLNNDDPGNPPMQLTYNTVNVAGPIFQSFLPGGNILYFGSTNDITIPITLSPIPTTILIAIAIPNNKTTAGTIIPFNVSTNIISNSQFMIFSTLNAPSPPIPYTFTWLAIGAA